MLKNYVEIILKKKGGGLLQRGWKSARPTDSCNKVDDVLLFNFWHFDKVEIIISCQVKYKKDEEMAVNKKWQYLFIANWLIWY